jgi:hypothetical protein
MTTTQTTRLQAVNQILSAVGEAPINTLEGALPRDAYMAINALDEVCVEVQSEAWDFNSETCVAFAPDGTGQIPLPESVVRIDAPPSRYPNHKYVRRGDRVYDKIDKTLVFTEPLELDVVYLLEWDDIPLAARRLIVARAARIFQDRTLGSANLRQSLLQSELLAKVALVEYDADTTNASIFTGWGVGRVLNRGNPLA